MRLTAKAVAALSMPAGKIDHAIWDEDMPGFGYRMRLGAGGKLLRSWIVQYKRGGASRRMLLGSAAVRGAEAARLEAKQILGRAALGENPAGDRRGRRDEGRNTMRSLADAHLGSTR